MPYAKCRGCGDIILYKNVRGTRLKKFKCKECNFKGFRRVAFDEAKLFFKNKYPGKEAYHSAMRDIHAFRMGRK
jgi:hypothetical protein